MATTTNLARAKVGVGAMKSPAEDRQELAQPTVGRDQARGTQAPPARDERPQRCGRVARLGSRHLHAEMRCRRAVPPGRHSQQARARKVGRSGPRQTARRARAPCRQPAPRLGRREPDTRGEARLRKGDQSPRRICRARQRVRLRFLRCLDAGQAGKRLRHHAALPRNGRRSGSRICRVFRALRPHCRPFDRWRR